MYIIYKKINLKDGYAFASYIPIIRNQFPMVMSSKMKAVYPMVQKLPTTINFDFVFNFKKKSFYKKIKYKIQNIIYKIKKKLKNFTKEKFSFENVSKIVDNFILYDEKIFMYVFKLSLIKKIRLKITVDRKIKRISKIKYLIIMFKEKPRMINYFI